MSALSRIIEAHWRLQLEYNLHRGTMYCEATDGISECWHCDDMREAMCQLEVEENRLRRASAS